MSGIVDLSNLSGSNTEIKLEEKDPSPEVVPSSTVGPELLKEGDTAEVISLQHATALYNNDIDNSLDVMNKTIELTDDNVSEEAFKMYSGIYGRSFSKESLTTIFKETVATIKQIIKRLWKAIIRTIREIGDILTRKNWETMVKALPTLKRFDSDMNLDDNKELTIKDINDNADKDDMLKPISSFVKAMAFIIGSIDNRSATITARSDVLAGMKMVITNIYQDGNANTNMILLANTVLDILDKAVTELANPNKKLGYKDDDKSVLSKTYVGDTTGAKLTTESVREFIINNLTSSLTPFNIYFKPYEDKMFKLLPQETQTKLSKIVHKYYMGMVDDEMRYIVFNLDKNTNEKICEMLTYKVNISDMGNHFPLIPFEEIGKHLVPVVNDGISVIKRSADKYINLEKKYDDVIVKLEKIEEIYASSDSYESKVVKEAIKIFTEILTVLLNGIATMINIKYRKIPQAIIWLVEFQAIVLRAFMQLKIVKH